MKDRLIKVILWRILSVLITLVFMFVLTGDIKTSTGITLLLHCFLTAAHFVFETAWEAISEG